MRNCTAPILLALFLMSGLANASIQEEFNQAEYVNREWQAAQMQKDINDIKDNQTWAEIEKANSSEE